jgi:hypothetical protein
VEDGRPAAGQTLDCAEVVGSGGTNCLGISRLNTIGASEGNDSARDMQTEDTANVASCYRRERRMAHRDVEGRMVRKGLGNQGELFHSHEDKEVAVTVSGPALDTGTVVAGQFV